MQHGAPATLQQQQHQRNTQSTEIVTERQVINATSRAVFLQ